MQVRWLKQGAGRDEVIVVFGGWAIGSQCFAHLTGGQDVLFVDDYRDLTGELPDLSAYARRRLVAWSFGVAAFGHWQSELGQLGRRMAFDSRVAVNGSLTPVHPKTGIPPRVFRQTEAGLSEASFQDFLTHSFNAPQPWQSFDAALHHAELLAVEARGAAPTCAWDRIWISGQDRIFPAQNLERAWADQPDAIRRIDAPHVAFAAWSAWQELWQ
jgi:pimeloyl-[acyl-carrier protein] methyl ester esterase